ncbi:hypothetical protein [Paramuribaculum intestinale]|nr:hypothetical protein [Paramuribaculum intestinale]
MKWNDVQWGDFYSLDKIPNWYCRIEPYISYFIILASIVWFIWLGYDDLRQHYEIKDLIVVILIGIFNGILFAFIAIVLVPCVLWWVIITLAAVIHTTVTAFLRLIIYLVRSMTTLHKRLFSVFSQTSKKRAKTAQNEQMNKSIRISDTRYKWTLIASSMTIIAVVAIWRYTDKHTDNGKYLYIDSRDNIHTSRSCSRLNYKYLKSYRVEIKEFDYYYRRMGASICPKCVSDDEYDSLTQQD